MKTAFFLLLRLICYAALLIVFAAGLSLIVVSLNGQCPRINSGIGVTCATLFWQKVADFGLGVMGYTLDRGYPIVLAVVGLIFFMRDLRGRRA